MAGRTPSRMSNQMSHPADDATASPLWPIVIVLGEIAERVARQHGEHGSLSPHPTCGHAPEGEDAR